MRRVREAADAERMAALQEAALERQNLDQQRVIRIQELEEELAKVRADLDSERQLRISEDAARREQERHETVERDEAVRSQLGDITNLVQDQRDEMSRKRELMDERHREKLARREEKDDQLRQLHEMVASIIADREAEKIRQTDEREQAAQKPGKPDSN